MGNRVALDVESPPSPGRPTFVDPKLASLRLKPLLDGRLITSAGFMLVCFLKKWRFRDFLLLNASHRRHQ